MTVTAAAADTTDPFAEFEPEPATMVTAAAADATEAPAEFEPEPAMTVTTAPAAGAIDAPPNAAAVAIPLLIDKLVSNENTGATFAEPLSEPARIVTVGPTDAAVTFAPLIRPRLPPDPAEAGTADAASPIELLDGSLVEAELLFPFPYPPASTMTALPAAVVVMAARPPGVKVADLITIALDEVVRVASAPDASPPANTVTVPVLAASALVGENN